MKKLVGLLIMVAFAALILSGCGGSQIKKDDMSEEVELVWYTPLFTEVTDLPLVTEKINAYLKTKINAKLKIVPVYGDGYNQKINVMTSAGEPFDLLFTCFWAAPFPNAVAQGQLMPLDDLLKDYGQGILKEEFPELWPAVTVKGKIYAVPDNGSVAYQQAFSFNKALVEKYSIDLPAIKTFPDLHSALKKVHAANAQLTCLSLNSFFYPADKFDFLVAPGVPGAIMINDKSCKIVNQFENPEFVSGLKIYRDMYNEGLIPRDKANGSNVQLFRRGDVVSEINVYGPRVDDWLGRTYGFPTVSIPANPNAVITTRSATGNMLAIPSTSKHPERAMMLLNLLTTDPYFANLVTFGLEGVHYTKIGPNRIKFTDKQKDFDISAPFTGNMMIKYMMETDPEGTLEDAKKANAAAIQSPAYGFTFDSEPVKTELSAMNNISEQFNDQLFMGRADTEPAIKQYMDKLKSAGLDKVLAEMQKQINEWLKTKK